MTVFEPRQQTSLSYPKLLIADRIIAMPLRATPAMLMLSGSIFASRSSVITAARTSPAMAMTTEHDIKRHFKHFQTSWSSRLSQTQAKKIQSKIITVMPTPY